MDYDLIWRKDARNAVLHNEGQAAVAAIEEIPAVEMRQHGYWKIEQHDRWLYPRCNLCGKLQDTKSNYCPNCGAIMDGKEPEHE